MPQIGDQYVTLIVVGLLAGALLMVCGLLAWVTARVVRLSEVVATVRLADSSPRVRVAALRNLSAPEVEPVEERDIAEDLAEIESLMSVTERL